MSNNLYQLMNESEREAWDRLTHLEEQSTKQLEQIQVRQAEQLKYLKWKYSVKTPQFAVPCNYAHV